MAYSARSGVGGAGGGAGAGSVHGSYGGGGGGGGSVAGSVYGSKAGGGGRGAASVAGGTPSASVVTDTGLGDMLELEHVIGYTGRSMGTLHCHPKRTTEFLCSLGANVVIGDIEDPHKQEFLRAHDEEVSALALSRSGLLIASGQLGSSRSPERVAPVVVWDYERRRQVFNLFGISQAVTALEFAPDDQFLAAVGKDNMVFVWDMQTGEQLVGKKFDRPVTFISWAPVLDSGRRPVYRLNFGTNNVMWMNTLQYQVKSMRYSMSSEAFALPSAGFVRDYAVGFCAGEYLVSGTVAGEFSVFSMKAKVYRASVRVSTNGVLAITGTGDDTIYVGSGDGKLQTFVGGDTAWKCVAEAQLRGKVVALSISADQTFLLAGTNSGRLYKVVLAGSKLVANELQESHIAGVSCVAFGTKRSDVFVTGSKDGTVRVWDLSDYRVLQDVVTPGAVSCVFFDETALLAGFEDGVLRYYDAASGDKLWSIRAHRGRVNSITGTELCLVSGGADYKVAVWSRKTREQLMDFHEHRAAVVSVLPDVMNPKLVHSAGADRCTYTYNLQTEKRVVGHQMGKAAVGQFTCMTQRVDSEQELVTAGTDGKLLYWDCDVAKPVMAVQDPAKSRSNAVAVSPSGQFLALCGDDHHVKVFETARGVLVAANLGHSAPVTDLKWSPDEKQIVSVGADCCICVWNWFGTE